MIPRAIQSTCGGCHIAPQPGRFTDRTWRAAIPFMYWLFQRFYPQPEGALSQDEVLDFYTKNAAKRLTPPTLFPRGGPDAPDFNLAPLLPERSPTLIASIEHLKTPQPNELLLIVDMLSGHIEEINLRRPKQPPALIAKATHPTRAIPYDLDGDGQRDYLVLELSTFGAKDIDRGQALALLNRQGELRRHPLLKGAGRVADAAIGDVDGDQRPDIVVADFGWQKTGGLRMLTKRKFVNGSLSFTEKRLDKMAGHIAVVLADMDQDGDLDIVDGLAQHHERIDLWTNNGSGQFSRRTIFTAKTPMWGLIGLRVVDIDGDGDQDVIHFNGDTLDAPKVARFQGVHRLENLGNGKFESRQLVELPGAHSVDTADFDGDGRLDIVAAANLPLGIHETLWSSDSTPDSAVDFESVLLLHQRPDGGFDTQSLLRNETCFSAVSAVDGDGDGDLDIILGPFGVGWSLLGHGKEKRGETHLRRCDRDQLYWLKNMGADGSKAAEVGQRVKGAPNEARRLEALRLVTRNDPSDVGYQISLSDALIKAGRFTEANQTMKAAVTHNPAEAVSLFESSCQGGKLDACTNLGVLYFDGEVLKKDPNRAAALYDRACRGGEENACANLALMYGSGVGVPRDEETAIKLLKTACDKKHLGACAKLGEFYAMGTGVPKNVIRARDLLQRACAGGVQSACPLVDQLKGGGLSGGQVSGSPSRLEGACRSGHIPSCSALGQRYATGSGVPRDMTKAVQYAELACQGGHAESCGNAGGAYFGGTGVPRDLKRARALLSKACQGGTQRACEFLKRLPAGRP